jgi:adenylate kinase family enzyme
MSGAEAWVIEGCYADLLAFAAKRATGAIWLDLPVETCTANARARPFEPHKYASPQAQDANLPMLIDWISAYDTRDDTLSRRAHQMLFDSFAGSKVTLRANSAVEDIPFPG